MNRENFYKLVDDLRPYITKQTTMMRVPLPPETRVAIFLYYISDEGRLLKTANAFGISKCTASVIINELAMVIFSVLGPKYIRVPKSEQEVNHMSENFKTAHGFPQCIGAIDGTHINIKAPTDSPTDFINRKKADFLLMFRLMLITNIVF